MTLISEGTRKQLLDRAERRCECQSPACRHHRPNTRCRNGLRGESWVARARAEGAGEKLWNLVAMCPQCAEANALLDLDQPSGVRPGP